MAADRGSRVWTAIEDARPFHAAEAYHQKYVLQREPALLQEILAAYPRGDGFVRSTAAARLNGWLAGYGTPEQVARDVERLGLSPEARARLLARIRTARR